eukprot:scaffold357_cov239-Pinguiococcus_pyrenoidosus.AAC.14
MCLRLKARQGKARQGKARQGKARQGKSNQEQSRAIKSNQDFLPDSSRLSSLCVGPRTQPELVRVLPREEPPFLGEASEQHGQVYRVKHPAVDAEVPQGDEILLRAQLFELTVHDLDGLRLTFAKSDSVFLRRFVVALVEQHNGFQWRFAHGAGQQDAVHRQLDPLQRLVHPLQARAEVASAVATVPKATRAQLQQLLGVVAW